MIDLVIENQCRKQVWFNGGPVAMTKNPIKRIEIPNKIMSLLKDSRLIKSKQLILKVTLNFWLLKNMIKSGN